jgi:transposase InsO family protein
LATDQGTSFISKEVREFVDSYGIKLLNSSPYYAQANGQAESSNKTFVKLVKKKIKDNLEFFQVGDLIWKTMLPIGSKSNKFGK